MSPALALRHEVCTALAGEVFDVLVIGGGITGAGIAREAALAGLTTALIERDDFASGTSSRSSRLVHGGVRYLEHGHLHLVFEASRERRLLLKLAPHLVQPLAFTWPVYRGARVPRWQVRAALTLYDVLSLFRNVRRHRSLSRDALLAAEPALTPDGLLGGARYYDAATDDARITLASALAAREAGAAVLNHITVTGAVHDGGRLVGVQAMDRMSGEVLTVGARIVVNATGPWSDEVSALLAPPGEGRVTRATVRGSAGAHVAVPRHRVGNHDAITIVSPLDGRVMFALPAGAHTIIGTTERASASGPDTIRATQTDVSYLLQSANRMFPFAQLTADDVIAAWCGIRPLAAARAGASRAGSASREHAVNARADGLLSVTGGKLTTYRAMAVDVLTHVRRALRAAGATPPPWDRSTSRTTPLPGGDLVSLEATMHDAAHTTHDAAVGERLAHAYGSRWRNVWSYVQRDHALGQRISDDLPYLLAEVPHAAEREFAATLADVLVRRTHVAFETRDNGRAAARRIAPLLQRTLGWSDAAREAQILAYDAEVARLFTVDAP